MLELKIINIDTGELLVVNETSYTLIKDMDPYYAAGYVIHAISCKDFRMDLQISFAAQNNRVFPVEKIEIIFKGFLKAKTYTETRNYFLSEMKKYKFQEEPTPMKFYNLTAQMVA